MFSSDLLQSFFTPEGLIAILLAIVIIAPYMLFFFRKGIVKQLVEECGIATKKDLDEAIYNLRTELLWKIDNLRAEQKADIKDLRVEQKADIKSIKDNDLQHINNDILNLRKDMDAKMELLRKELEALRKAVLLLAQKYVDDPERLERIKDLLTI
ncbi:MAG: hypothetical protein MdMp024_0344 [Bacteroidales bacterium]